MIELASRANYGTNSANSTYYHRLTLRKLALIVGAALVLCSRPTQLPAQSGEQTPASQSKSTFEANTRVVLTDVTVTDGKGNPVHGLAQSAFQLFDNNKLQEITSFEEPAAVPAVNAVSTSTSGVYSNDYLRHLPPVLNVVLIDIANLHMADQMYLHNELKKFLNQEPEGQLLAVYLRRGSGCFLVQNFTSDRKLLLDAVDKAIPRFPPPNPTYLSDIDTMRQTSSLCGKFPVGRMCFGSQVDPRSF